MPAAAVPSGGSDGGGRGSGEAETYGDAWCGGGWWRSGDEKVGRGGEACVGVGRGELDAPTFIGRARAWRPRQRGPGAVEASSEEGGVRYGCGSTTIAWPGSHARPVARRGARRGGW